MPPFPSIAILAAALWTSSARGAESWQCTNAGLAEIQCEAGRCTLSPDGFTPIRISAAGADVELCAYAGCRSGRLAHGASPDHLHWTGAVALEDGKASPEPLSLVIEPAEGTGVLLWKAFANPLRCEAAR